MSFRLCACTNNVNTFNDRIKHNVGVVLLLSFQRAAIAVRPGRVAILYYITVAVRTGRVAIHYYITVAVRPGRVAILYYITVAVRTGKVVIHYYKTGRATGRERVRP
jgi:hypothetical protein